MSSVSLFEQLTSSVSLSMLAIVSTAILALLLVYTVACRLFFSSSKSEDTSSNKDKKSNTKKHQGDTPSSNKKKNVIAVSSSSPSTQSEESENEKATLVAPTKKSTSPSKVSTGKKVVITANNKTDGPTNEIKTSTAKQQQAPGRAENVEGKKQVRNGVSDKQQTSGKNNAVPKVNTTNPNKKQTVAVNSELKPALTVAGVAGSDQEDEGQWVTQGSKQVNNRHRNKSKTEPPINNNQTSPSALSNRNVVTEKRTVPPTTNKTESDGESINRPIQNQEPIEISQLLPRNENRYTANDNWWKQALNKQQTFSVDDIGEWPEREQDEQYTIQIQRIIPIKKVNQEQGDNEL